MSLSIDSNRHDTVHRGYESTGICNPKAPNINQYAKEEVGDAPGYGAIETFFSIIHGIASILSLQVFQGDSIQDGKHNGKASRVEALHDKMITKGIQPPLLIGIVVVDKK